MTSTKDEKTSKQLPSELTEVCKKVDELFVSSLDLYQQIRVIRSQINQHCREVSPFPPLSPHFIHFDALTFFFFLVCVSQGLFKCVDAKRENSLDLSSNNYDHRDMQATVGVKMSVLSFIECTWCAASSPHLLYFFICSVEDEESPFQLSQSER
jgi:hypothetical protein